MYKKIEIYPSTVNPADASPFFSNIPTPISRLISWKEKKQAPAFLFSLSNAYVSPYGVVFKNGKVVKEAVYKYSAKKKWDNLLSFIKKKITNKVIKIDGDCILIHHSWYQNYYHWMIEIMPRLFLMKDQLSDKRLVIHKNISKFHLETLSKFNFKDIVFIEDNELIKCQKISFTSFPNFYTNQTLTIGSQSINLIELNINFCIMREMKQWIQNNNPLLKNEIYFRNEKIYISRKKAGHRKILNEPELDVFFNETGFKKIFLEDISFDEQIELLHNASIVVGIHGAGLSNILFMRPGTHVINLISDKHYEFCYLNIASMASVNYSHVNCSSGTLKANPAYNDITVDVKLLKEILTSINTQ
ncbi:MAG: glycosyltransferase family 61 protein [Bacteroidota bacterium]